MAIPANTVLMLHAEDQAGGSQVVSDELGHTFTTNGLVSIDDTDSKFGDNCIKGSGGGINVTDPSNDFVFGTGDLTIEFFIKFSGNRGDDWGGVLSTGYYTGNSSITVRRGGGGDSIITTLPGNTNVFIGTLNDDQWYHVALSRESGTLRTFLDGTLGDTRASAHNFTDDDLHLFFDSQVLNANCRLDEVRVAKSAVYTSTFTPPSSPLEPPLASTPVTPTTFNDYVDSLNPVARYRLGETSGTVATDETGTYDGTYEGSPTLGVSGLLVNDLDTAVTFDGVNQRVQLPNVVMSPITTQYSVSFIVDNTSTTAGVNFYALNAAGVFTIVDIVDSTTLRFLAKTSGGDKSFNVTLPTIVAKIHIVLTFDEASELIGYINGIQVGSVSTLSGSAELAGSLGCYLMSARDGTEECSGTMDEFSLFDTVLTEEQILTMYALARIDSANYLPHHSHISALSPEAHYRLGEGAGTVAVDETGTYNGIYVGSPTLGATGLIAGDANTAVTFDGVDDEVIVTVTNFLSASTSGSINLTFSTPTVGDFEFLFGVGDENNSANALSIYTTDSSSLRLFVYNGNGATFQSLDTPTGSISANTTHHVTITSDGSTVSIMLDGAIVPITVTNGTNRGDWFAAVDGVTDNLTIGSLRRDTVSYGNATIDEVAIFDTTLTEEQLNLLYVSSKIDLTQLLSTTLPSIVVTIVENLIVENWRGVAHLLDGTLVKIFDMVEGSNTLDFDSDPAEPIALTVLPNHGGQWSASTAYALDDIVYPIDALTVPYYLKCTVAGTSGAAEPTWGQGLGQVDGTATWDFVELIPNALSKYPINV